MQVLSVAYDLRVKAVDWLSATDVDSALVFRQSRVSCGGRIKKRSFLKSYLKRVTFQL
jgi:hypothetical protein